MERVTEVLSERTWAATLTGYANWKNEALGCGPVLVTVRVTQVTKEDGTKCFPSYYVSAHGEHLFGGVAAHLNPETGRPSSSGGPSILWGDELPLAGFVPEPMPEPSEEELDSLAVDLLSDIVDEATTSGELDVTDASFAGFLVARGEKSLVTLSDGRRLLVSVVEV